MLLTSILLVTLLMVGLVPAKIIDLSHDHGPDTFMFPGMPHFNRSTIKAGEYYPGVYVEGGQYFSGEHGGTHMDAPGHFSRGGQMLHQVPLENTIAEGVMIDCSKEAKQANNYSVPLKKIQDWEAEHGQIPMGAAIIFNFNWSERFSDISRYVGKDYNDQFKFVYPSVSPEVGRWLYEKRDVKIIGADTISPDPILKTGLPIHQLYLPNNKLIMENLKGTEKLPPRGFRFHAAPVKYVGNTGAQVRAYAMTFDEDMNNSASIFDQGQSLGLVLLVFLVSRAYGLLA